MTVYFNPRPREEGDASSVGYKPQSDDFNPRPREEGDLLALKIIQCRLISIHALVKRATNVVNNYIRVAGISIHALVKRATKRSFKIRLSRSISIHALVKRATSLSLR